MLCSPITLLVIFIYTSSSSELPVWYAEVNNSLVVCIVCNIKGYFLVGPISFTWKGTIFRPLPHSYTWNIHHSNNLWTKERIVFHSWPYQQQLVPASRKEKHRETSSICCSRRTGGAPWRREIRRPLLAVSLRGGTGREWRDLPRTSRGPWPGKQRANEYSGFCQ